MNLNIICYCVRLDIFRLFYYLKEYSIEYFNCPVELVKDYYSKNTVCSSPETTFDQFLFLRRCNTP